MLFKPKVCSSLVNIYCHGNKEGAKWTQRSWGSTCSSGMKSSCCRQSQPGFARREVNLEASSWQLRRILCERGGVTPGSLHLPGAPGGSQGPCSTIHLCWESLKCWPQTACTSFKVFQLHQGTQQGFFPGLHCRGKAAFLLNTWGIRVTWLLLKVTRSKWTAAAQRDATGCALQCNPSLHCNIWGDCQTTGTEHSPRKITSQKEKGHPLLIMVRLEHAPKPQRTA